MQDKIGRCASVQMVCQERAGIRVIVHPCQSYELLCGVHAIRELTNPILLHNHTLCFTLYSWMRHVDKPDLSQVLSMRVDATSAWPELQFAYPRNAPFAQINFSE